jgi:hypothetical protein
MITQTPTIMRALTAVLCLGALAACASSDAANAVARWKVDAEPALDIASSADDGSVVFVNASAATRLSSGMVVVADATDAMLRFFDASGRQVRTVGRRGGGPGEFRALAWLGQCGADSLYVGDYVRGQFSVIDSAGNFVRTYPYSGREFAQTCSRTGIFAGLELPEGTGMPSERGETYHAPLWLADANGDTLRTFAPAKLGENRPLGRMTKLALAGERIYVGTADSAFVDVYSTAGQKLGVVAVGENKSRRPSERNFERAINAMVMELPGRESQERAREMLLKIPPPEQMPSYSAIFTDPAGTLWVNLSAPGDGETRLRAVGADGAQLGEVVLPLDLVVFEVGEDYVLGRWEDEESGEVHVRMYRFRRG